MAENNESGIRRKNRVLREEKMDYESKESRLWEDYVPLLQLPIYNYINNKKKFAFSTHCKKRQIYVNMLRYEVNKAVFASLFPNKTPFLL